MRIALYQAPSETPDPEAGFTALIAPDGTELTRAERGEELLVADVDPAALRRPGPAERSASPALPRARVGGPV